MKSVFLVVTSALAIAGSIAAPGDLIEVSEAEAVNFLNRGKARLATAEDGVEIDDADMDAPADEGEDDKNPKPGAKPSDKPKDKAE